MCPRHLFGRTRGLFVVLFLMVIPQTTQAAQSADLEPRVFSITAPDNVLGNRVYYLTGFLYEVDGELGLVTALHGIARGSTYSAENATHNVLNGLTLAKVDVPNDAAFLLLNGAPLPREYGAFTKGQFPSSGQHLRVIGYPQHVPSQRYHPLDVASDRAHSPLGDQIPHLDQYTRFSARNSPDLKSEVIWVTGRLQAGYSGAPVVDLRGNVVGIGNGGLQGGTVDINWIIPIGNLHWSPAR